MARSYGDIVLKLAADSIHEVPKIVDVQAEKAQLKHLFACGVRVLKNSSFEDFLGI